MTGGVESPGTIGPVQGRTVHHGALRWTAAIVLLVIVAVLVPLAVTARFARGELLNTDRYVATVAPLASDPAVQSALTDRVTNEIVSRIDLPALIQQATGQLNLRAGPLIDNLLSGPVTDWLTNFIHQHVQKFVASPAFATLWTNVNRLAHQGVNRLLTGEQGGIVAASGDSVVLNIGPIVDAAKQALVADGFRLAGSIPSVDAQYTLFQSDQLPRAQRTVRLLNTLANWLPWIIAALFALAVWLAPNRRRAAIAGLVAAAVLLVVTFIGVKVGRHAYADQLTRLGRNRAAGLVIYDSMLRSLLAAAVTALVASVVAIVWVWLAGPGRAGSAVRRATGHGFQRLADGLGWRHGGFAAFVDRYHGWIYAVLGVAGFVILLHSPSLATVAWIVLVALLVTAAVAVLHRLRGPRPVAT
jgi:hypothetical protein